MNFNQFISTIALLFLITTQSFASASASTKDFSKNNLPLAENYKTTDIFQGKPKPVDLNSHPQAKEYRTALKEGAAAGPNFAGHYTVVSIGCGTMCSMLWITDAKSGKIITTEMQKNNETPKEIAKDIKGTTKDIISTSMGEKYNLNSKLLITNPPENFKDWEKIPTWAETSYFILEDNKMKKIFSIPTAEISNKSGSKTHSTENVIQKGDNSMVNLEKANQKGNNSMANLYIYKIMTQKDWNESQELGYVKPSVLDKESNFIHMSQEHQIQKVMDKFMRNEEEVVVLKLDPSKFQGRLIKEKNPGGTEEYYHLYEGKVPLEAIVEITKK